MPITQEELEAFCRKYHIQQLAFFGSVLTDQFGPQSDIDVLVEFDPEHVPGLITFAEIELKLSELFGHKVDLNTRGTLSQFFRDQVIKEARVQYDVK